MNIPPLCIIQARYHSTRLPGKMLLQLGGETLIARAWRIACEAFGAEHCVITMPASDLDTPLGDETERIQANRSWFQGNENDVLARFYVAAHTYRWHHDSVIVRYTPDDPWKDAGCLRRVANGERFPVEFGGEAFTLAQLDRARHTRGVEREHLTRVFFDVSAPNPAIAELAQWGSSVLSIDTQADYDACLQHLGR